MIYVRCVVTTGIHDAIANTQCTARATTPGSLCPDGMAFVLPNALNDIDCTRGTRLFERGLQQVTHDASF